MATLQQPSGARSYIDTKALMAIRNLELRARVVMEGFWNGLHRSPYHGFSVEFTEYRQYTPGDDPRYLDWRLYARSDRYYLKKFEDETNLRSYFVVDNSRSMGFGSLAYNKSAYARTVAATLAYFLHQQGDGVGLLSFDEKLREYLPAKRRGSHLRQLMLLLDKPEQGQTTDLSGPLDRILQLLLRRSLIIVISDFLAPLESFSKNLSHLRACGHDVMIVQVLDPAEIDFKFDRSSLFYDLESGRDLYVDPDTTRDQYQQRLSAHNANLRSLTFRLGASYYLLRTDDPPERVLLSLVHDRMQRGKKLNRVASG